MSKNAKDVSLLEGFNIVRAAWDQVTPVAVKNCWRKSGLVEDDNLTQPDVETDYVDMDVSRMKGLKLKKSLLRLVVLLIWKNLWTLKPR